jgi:hypothetical protein
LLTDAGAERSRQDAACFLSPRFGRTRRRSYHSSQRSGGYGPGWLEAAVVYGDVCARDPTRVRGVRRTRPWQPRAATAPRLPGAAEFSRRRQPSAAYNRHGRPDGERPGNSLVRRNQSRSRCSQDRRVSPSEWKCHSSQCGQTLPSSTLTIGEAIIWP